MLNVYVDLSEVPSDINLPPDVGDGGDVSGRFNEAVWRGAPLPQPTFPPMTAAQMAPATQANLVVPFTRTIQFRTGGTDVKGVKRAIWRGNDLKLSTFTPVFGPIAVRELKTFQERHALKTDGVVGPATLHKLAPYFDRYAFLLYEGYPPGLNPVAAKRQMMFAYLLWGYNNRPSIFYFQFRPMDNLNALYHLPESEDCSTFYTKGAKAARWSDPNNCNYCGAGNTTTLVAHGREVTIAQLQIGDGVFYSNPAHVGGYVGGGRIISLGSSAGPSLTPINYRSDFAQARSYL